MSPIRWPWSRSRGASQGPPDPSTWDLRREGERVVLTDAKGTEHAFTRGRARSVRVVPLGAGASHGGTRGMGGWQVAVSETDGDVPLGPPLADGRQALALARRVAEEAGLAVDETSERMFAGLSARGGPSEA